MTQAYFSEIRYDDPGNKDFVEVAVTSGTDMSGWSVAYYAEDGTLNTTWTFGSPTSTTAGKDVYVVSGNEDLANRKGYALVDDTGTVVQFISFANSITAVDGPAAGMTSDQLGDLTTSGQSMETTDAGASYQMQAAPNEGTITCFTSGTLILTSQGEVPIETLNIGDLVCTMDNGPQPIAWIGKRHCGQEELRERENLRPVLIPKGVLGVKRDLLVSRQHGMLFGQDHLARAIHLTEALPGVRIAHGKREVTYIHLMFEAHQIIFAEGAPSESFYPGRMAMQMMSAEACRDLTRRFPKLLPSLDIVAVQRIYGDTARPFLKKKELPELLDAA